MRLRLTDRTLQALKPPAEGRLEIVDTEAPGLALRITARGSKSWAIRYRPKGGTQQRASYGTYPTISLAAVRQRAREIAVAAAKGIDLPATEAEEREEQKRRDGRPQTVVDLLDEYVERHCKARQRRWTATAAMFLSHVKPALGRIPLEELRRGDVVELLDDLQNRKHLSAQVNRVRTQILAALNWAVEREYLDANPAAGIKRRKIEASRDRVLTDAELRAIWQAADALSDPGRAFVKALILTGQRRDEVRCMTWSEVDQGRALWLLPAARSKAKRGHEIPLSPMMLELLGGLCRHPGARAGAPVFTISGTKPYAAHQPLKRTLDRVSGVSGWTFHDFRRTASTGMAALHVPQDTIDRVLNHAKGTLAGTYNRHGYLEEKRRALDVWAERVAFIVGERGENVVELRAGA